jgi:hypothetical protein
MNDTPAPDNGATVRARWTPPSTATIAKCLARLQTTLSSELKSVYGATLRGVVPRIFAPDGTTPLTAAIRLIIDDGGDAVGFILGNEDTIDYRTPEDMGALWHASNSNLARTLRHPAIEERLARAFTAIRLEDEMLAATAMAGLRDFTRIKIPLAHKIAYGVVSECIANATDHFQQGSLNVLRSIPPTIRFALIHPLLADEKAELIRDMLLAAPILALAPTMLVARAGEKPKDILKELGLPVEARKLLARALSPYRRLMLHDGRDLASGDCPWLTPELLTALPEHSLNQYRMINICFGLRLREVPDDKIAERAIWAARNSTELFKDKAHVEPLLDWLRADPTALKRYEVRGWSQDISTEHAIAAARDMQEMHTRLKEMKTKGSAFIVPDWCDRKERLPASKWFLRPIRNEEELIAASRRSSNCAAAYADDCKRGAALIVEIIRPVYECTGLPNDGESETGAMVELSFGWNRWHIVQSKGFANKRAQPSAVQALDRLITQINDSNSNSAKEG